MMITKHDIENAKRACALGANANHEHDDCILMAYEWLDAQIPTKRALMSGVPLKHVIENWAGRYISQSDVEIAAYLHLYFRGKYPRYNFSTKNMIEPSIKRLEHISEAFKHENYRKAHDPTIYHTKE